MHEEPKPMTAWPRRSRRRRLSPLVLFAALSLLLAACGGGGGGGNGTGNVALKLAVVNKTDADLSVSLDTVEAGEPTVVGSCKASLVTFPLPAEDWTVVMNGEVVLDSLELEPELVDPPVNLIGEIVANEDGTYEQKELRPGRVKATPAQLGICV